MYEDVLVLSGAFGVTLNSEGIITHTSPSFGGIVGAPSELYIGTRWDQWYKDGYLISQCDDTPLTVRVTSVTNVDGSKLWVESDKSARDASSIASHYREDIAHLEYAISHDLFEPLRGVTQSLSMFQDQYKDTMTTDQVDLINQANGCAHYIHRLLTDFLDYLRIDVHRKRDLIRPISLNTVMDDVIQSLRLLIEEADVEITYGDLPTVLGDGRMLHQIFSNLISNAVKFRDKTRPCKIEVTAKPNGFETRIQVKDNGRGIHNAKIPRIFSPFVRIHKDVSGSGIGLAIVKRCVEFHGGTISVESDIGEGTTMSFTLPEDLRDAWSDEPTE